MAHIREKLPQEGPSRIAAGESLTEPSGSVCPSYSGGGNICHSENTITEQTLQTQEMLECNSANRRKRQENDDIALTTSFRMDDENAGSDCSFVTMTSQGPNRFWQSRRKRLRTDADTDLSLSSGDDRLTGGSGRSRSPIMRRPRGRPPTTGEYVGLAKAKAALNAEKQKELRLREEQDLAESAAQYRQARAVRLSEHPAADSEDNAKTTAQWQQQVLDDVALIGTVATKSRNLKTTYVRDLKNAVASIKEAVAAIGSRTVSEETKLLQEENARLQAELTGIRNELQSIRAELKRTRQRDHPSPSSQVVTAEPPTAQDDPHPSKVRRVASNKTVVTTEEICRAVMLQVGTMINARFDSIQDRLLPERNLRPPLATSQRPVWNSTANTPTGPIPGSRTNARTDGSGNLSSKDSGGRKKKAGTRESEAIPMPPPPPRSEPWNVVTGRNTKKGSKEQQSQPQSRPQEPDTRKKRRRRKRPRKLRPPRSAAIVLTLQPEAEAKGVTYAQVFSEAKKRVALTEIGINGLNFKKAATGARILEVSGPNNTEQADSLAQKLRELFSEDLVRVSRPVKCAELRVSGLDDSVTSADVAAAVAREGGCPIEQIRTGEVTHGATGLGTVWLRCPVAAAKKVIGGTRLLVGWVSAQVRLLENRPQRCFRCLEVGHMRTHCTSALDRSDECYRCGKPGHKASKCSALPHCNLCSAAGRPADHRLGSKACAPVRSGKSKGKSGSGSKATEGPANLSTRQAEEADMAIG